MSSPPRRMFRTGMATDAEIRTIAEEAATRAAAKVVQQQPSYDEVREMVQESVNRSVKDAVRDAAQLAVADALISFGLDPKDRSETMKDFSYLRDIRKLSGDTRKHVTFAFLTLLVGAIVFAIWAGIKYSVKIP